MITYKLALDEGRDLTAPHDNRVMNSYFTTHAGKPCGLRQKPLSALTLSISRADRPAEPRELFGEYGGYRDAGAARQVELSASALANQVFFIVSLAVGGIADAPT